MKAFSFATGKGSLQIGVEYKEQLYNFSRAWEWYKKIESKGQGPSLVMLQIMVEADFFHLDTFQEVFTTLEQHRSLEDLVLNKDISYRPPISRPQKILCIGRNYKEHALELGNEVPEEPIFFSKSPSSIIAHGEEIKLPSGMGNIEHEGELAVIIGKQANHVSEKEALEFVAGYSVINDVTARSLQKADTALGKPWFRAKSFDTFCPFGPYLVVKDSIKNLKDLQLQVKVNQEIRQKASIADMIFPVSYLVSYLSQFCTLQPGDVIATGTPAGVGLLESGDLVECEISEIGILKNLVA